MNWIRMATKTKNDPKVGAIAAACAVSVAHAVGLVSCVFMELPDHARDGNVSRVPDMLLEQWALWGGRAGVFAKAFRAQLCDESGVIRAWERHNGAAIRRAEADIARKRAAEEARKSATPRAERPRKSAKLPAESVRKSAQHLADDAADSAPDSAELPPRVRDGSRVDETLRTPSSASSDADEGARGASSAEYAVRRGVFVAELPEHTRDALRGYLRSAQFPDAVLAHLEAVRDGLSGPGMAPVAVEHIGQALTEMRVAGVSPFTPAAFAGFLRRIVQPPPEPGGPGVDLAPGGSPRDPDAAAAAAFLERVRRGEFVEVSS